MSSKISSRIVLLGGGHSHVQVVKKWAMSPAPGVELVLVSHGAGAPYSGMLPGRMAGMYSDEEMHFNLPAICASAGVVFIDARVSSLDPERREVHMPGRAPLNYDLVSLNVGLRPEIPEGGEGNPLVIPVKPISGVLSRWDELWNRGPDGDWLIVGGGAAGFELSMIAALHIRRHKANIGLHLLDSHERILQTHGKRVSAAAEKLLRNMGVQLHSNSRIQEFRGNKALATDGKEFTFAQAIVATGGRAPEWLGQSGLPVDERGFVRVDSFLRVEGHQDIFAAGDCIRFVPRNLPKSGVFAVREGPVLFENLKRAVSKQKSLRPYRPQQNILALLTSGEKRALLSYGGLTLEGEWLWRWKDRIDRRFMRMFSLLPRMEAAIDSNTCGGCGGKLAAHEVERVVERLRGQKDLASLLPGSVQDVGWLDNIAVSIDGFRTFTGDLDWLGEVAIHHAFNDIFASGCGARGATVFVALPAASEYRRSNHLEQLMTGVLRALKQHKAFLLNAHSAEGSEPTIVVSAMGTGTVRWGKSTAKEGDVLILTKALGTGAVLQGLMQGRISIPGWDELKDILNQHHGELPGRLEALVHACTDISGFGLLGHLSEMLGGDQLGAELQIARLPSLVEFRRMHELGVRSFLADGNRADFGVRVSGDLGDRDWHLLCDPQTHGPLLFSVAAQNQGHVLGILRDAGFAGAAVIGHIRRGPNIHFS